MRHKTPLVATIAVAALLLAGCSSGGEAISDSELATKDTKATIDYAIWNAAQQSGMEKVIAAFNEEYPNITVQLQVTPFEQYFTKLQTQGSSKTLPDVFTMNQLNSELYIDAGMLAPVTPLEDAGRIDPQNYPEALVEGFSSDEALYGIPQNSQTIAMWYNKDLFEEAGVDTPTDDWTWEDLQTAAKTISDALHDKGVFGIATDLTGQQAYYNTMLQAGGQVISDDKTTSGFDDPKSIEGLQFWTDLISDGSSPSVQQLADTPAPQMYNAGKAAMMFNGAWSVAEVLESPVADASDVAPLPQAEDRGVVVAGTAAVVSAFSENKPAAMAFQEFLGSEEAQGMLAAEGLGNPAFGDAQHVFVESAPQYNVKAFTDASEYASAYPVSLETTAWNQLESKLLPAAFSGEKPVKEVATSLASQMNELLAEETK